MTLAGAIRARLLQVTPVTAIVVGRIYALTLPQNVQLPALRIQEIDRVEYPHLMGVNELKRARVQIDAVTQAAASGDPYQAAHALCDAVHGTFDGGGATGLAGWTGAVGTPPITIAGMLPDGRREIFDADDLHEVKVTQDFIVWFRSA